MQADDAEHEDALGTLGEARFEAGPTGARLVAAHVERDRGCRPAPFSEAFGEPPRQVVALYIGRAYRLSGIERCRVFEERENPVYVGSNG